MKNILKLLSGSDGELSLRRILGAALTICGIVLSFTASPPIDSSWQAILWSLRGVILIVAALFLFGIVTAQNIKDMATKGKDNA